MKGIGKKSISVLMTLVMLAGILADLHWGFSAVEVFAATYEAEITSSRVLINGMDITDNNNTVDFSNGSYPFDIQLDWKISNENITSNSGDQIRIELPQEIKFVDAIGTASLGGTDVRVPYTVKNGVLTFTLPIQSSGSNIYGQLRLNGTLNNDELSNLENGTHSFNILGKEYILNVQNKNKTSSLDVWKYTTSDSYDSENGYNYVVEITSHGSNSGITVSDVFGTNMELTSEVTVSSSIAGNSVSGLLSGSTEKGFTYNIDYKMADGEKLFIRYSAKVPDSIFDSFTGSLDVRNTAIVKSSESTEKSGEDIKWLSRNLVTKSAQLSADGQTINWTITVNGMNPIDVSGGIISDVLPGDYEITSDVVMTSSKGETVVLPNDGRGFSYTFPEGSNATYTIHFTTSVDTSGIPVVSGGDTGHNKAQLTLNGKTYDSNEAYVHIPGIPNFHTKKAASYRVETIDGKDVGVIHWVNTITVPNPAVCPLYDFTFYDNGASWQQVTQKVRDGSLSVTYNGKPVNASSYQYRQFNNANTFQIDFGDYFASAKENEIIEISYDTYFDLVSYETQVYNYSQVKLDDKAVSEANDSYKFVPLVSKSIIQTMDAPQSLNKIFKWCVKIDLSNIDDDDIMPNILVFKDILPENQTLVPNTVELWDSMWYDGNPQKISGATETDGSFSVEINKNQLSSKKETGGNFVYLHYNTTFADVSEFLMSGSKTYVNAVEVYNKETDELIDKASVSTGTITPPENKVLDKRLVLYNDYTAGFADYAIDVNTAGIKYLKEDGAKLKLTDKLGNALRYVTGSLKVYTNPEHTDQMELDLYTLNYNKDTNTLELLLPDQTPCYITYTAKVIISKDQYPTFSTNPSDPNYAGNDVTLEGFSQNNVQDNVTLSGSVANTSGTINYNSASISLYKSDSKNFAKGLDGAQYTAKIVALWDSNRKEPILATDAELAKRGISDSVKTQSTQNGGMLLFSGLRYDCLYEITETKAPDKYQLSNDKFYIYFVGNDKSDFCRAYKGNQTYSNIEEISRDENDTSNDDLFYEMLVRDKELPKELKSIQISKQAAFGGTSAELEGATLRITDNAGNTVAEWTTGSSSRKFYIYEDGIDESEYEDLLRPGVNYTLEEVSAPSGYTIAEPITFSVDDNGNISGTGSNTLVMKDNRAIYINKVDSDGNSLSGAVLTVSGGNLSTPISFTTDGSAHRLEVSKNRSNNTLEPGVTYTLSETTTPNGYKTIGNVTFLVDNNGRITANGQDGEVTANGVTLTVTDKTLVDLKVIKQDTNGNLLSGAVFELYRVSDNGTKVQITKGSESYTGKDGSNYSHVYKTKDKGEVSIPELTYGDYILVEKEAPAGYDIISAETPITLGGTGANAVPIVNGVATKTIVNSRILNEKGNITIIKTDRNSITPVKYLSGAVFTLTSTDGTPFYNATATTNEDGKAEFLNVPYGTYILKEKNTPYGYAFTQDDNYTATNSYGILASAQADVSTCTVILDATHTKSTFGTTNTFEINVTNTQKYGSLSFEKVDAYGNGVSDAIFTLTDNEDSTNTYEKKSVNGKVLFEGLPYGTYTLKETTIPEYYSGWFRTEGISVTIDDSTVDNNGINTLKTPVVNTRLRVGIDKRDLTGTTTLPGATLGIYAEGTKDLDNTTPLLYWETDTETGTKFIELGTDIQPGKYILHEIEPPSNYKRADNINFEVMYDSTSRTATIKADGHVENNVLVMRDEPIGTLRLLKKDSTIINGENKPLNDAVFILYSVSDDGTTKRIDGPDGDYTTKDNVTYQNVFKTKNGGEIRVSDLPYGTYIFEEIGAPSGYTITNVSTTFVLSDDTKLDEKGIRVEEQIVYNTPITVEPTADIKIVKVDNKNQDENLDNARFELYRMKGGDKEFIVGNTTDLKGEILFEDIPYGTYILMETVTPPNYKFGDKCTVYINGNPKKDGITWEPLEIKNIVINDANVVKNGDTNEITIQVENELRTRSVYVKKFDDVSGEVLENAKFALYNDEDCTSKAYPVNAESVTTNAKGIAEFENVSHGTYWLKEVSAPVGYEREEEAVRVEVKDSTTTLYTEENPYEVFNTRIILHIKKNETGTIDTVVDGAQLAIYEYKDGKKGDLLHSWTSGTKNGQLSDLLLYFKPTKEIQNPTNGNYIYKGTFVLAETKAPNGYLEAQEILFDVTDKGTITNIRLNNSTQTAPNINEAKTTNDDRTLILYDEPCGSVKITKKDSQNGVKLAGAEFTICPVNDSISAIDNVHDFNSYLDGLSDTQKSGLGIQSGTTKSDGTLEFIKLKPGKYAIFETGVPIGYDRISERYDVTITGGSESIPTELSITNITADKTGNIKIIKTSKSDNSKLNGAIFKLVKEVDGKQVEVATGATKNDGTEDGVVLFKNVLYGEYNIIEVTPPAGHSISLESNNYEVLDKKTIHLIIDEKNCPMNNDGTPATIQIDVTDDILRGNLELLKIDKDRGAGLENVYFALKDTAGKYFNKKNQDFDNSYTSSSKDNADENEYWFKTDASGKLTIENIPFNTKANEYTLVEVSVPDNVKWNDADTAVIVATGIIIDKDNSQPDFMATTIPQPVENELLKSNFKIRKIGKEWTPEEVADNKKKGLENAVYELYSDVDKNDQGEVVGLKNLVATGITDSTGTYTFENLVYGTYYLKEKEAPVNYMIDQGYKIVTISDAGITMQDVEITDLANVSDEIGMGSLTIVKKGLGDELLPGVEFELYGLKKDGTGNTTDAPIQRGETSNSGDDYGTVTFKDLNYGYYMVKEVGVPEYYVALEEIKDSIPVTADFVNSEGRVEQKIEITNHNISFRISKRAANTIYDLDGAILGIFDVGTSEANFTTDVAKIWWETSDAGPKEIYLGDFDKGADVDKRKLKPGEYILAEIKAPEGYDKANPMRFKVEADGKVELLNPGMTDDPENKRTPGELSNVPMGPDGEPQYPDSEYQNPILIMYDDEIVCNIAIGKKVREQNGTISENYQKGIRFRIVKADNKNSEIASWESLEEPRLFSVGTGKVLSYETDYLLIEEYAPAGLMLAEQPIPFYISRRDGDIVIGSVNDNQVAKADTQKEYPGEVSKYSVNGNEISMLTMVDNVWDGSFYISKREMDKTVELPNAELWLINTEDPNDIKRWNTSNQPWKLTVGSASDQIKPGVEYRLHEANAPEGYMLAPDIIFEINSNAVVTVTDYGNGYVEIKGGIPTIVMQDAIKGSKEDDIEPTPDAFTNTDGSPKTGDDTPLVLLIILLIVAAAVIAGLAITGRKKEKQETTEDEEDENS